MSRTEKSLKKKPRNYCATLGFGRLLKTIRNVSLFLTTDTADSTTGCIRIKLLVEGIKIIIRRLKPEYRRYFGESGLDR